MTATPAATPANELCRYRISLTNRRTGTTVWFHDVEHDREQLAALITYLAEWDDEH